MRRAQWSGLFQNIEAPDTPMPITAKLPLFRRTIGHDLLFAANYRR